MPILERASRYVGSTLSNHQFLLLKNEIALFVNISNSTSSNRLSSLHLGGSTLLPICLPVQIKCISIYRIDWMRIRQIWMQRISPIVSLMSNADRASGSHRPLHRIATASRADRQPHGHAAQRAARDGLPRHIRNDWSACPAFAARCSWEMRDHSMPPAQAVGGAPNRSRDSGIGYIYKLKIQDKLVILLCLGSQKSPPPPPLRLPQVRDPGKGLLASEQ